MSAPQIERRGVHRTDATASPWQPMSGSTPLVDLLGIRAGCTVAVMGAGGKHTLMGRLQEELTAIGQAVLLTSSTNLHRPSGGREPQLLLVEAGRHWQPQLAARMAEGRPAYVLQHEMGPSMLKGLSTEQLAALRGEHPEAVMIIKADGARKRRFKAPAAHEPIVPPFSDICVVVVGIDCLGQTLDERFVHRPEIVARLAGIEVGGVLSTEVVARVIGHDEWYASRLPDEARRVLYVSKVAAAGQREQAYELLRRVPESAFPLCAAGNTPQGQVERFSFPAGA